MWDYKDILTKCDLLYNWASKEDDYELGAIRQYMIGDGHINNAYLVGIEMYF